MYRIGANELEELKKVIEAKDLFKINGGLQESGQVERKLKEKFGAAYSLFMTSGYAALVSALVALGVGPGDEVIVPGYTYIATAMAVVGAGAMPVVAEIDETLTLDPDDVEKKITPRTKAIIPVHIQGFPCDMDRLVNLAQRHGLLVLEDACQADGGSYKGRRLGTIGHAGAFSFNFFKLLTCGEGGALLTSDKQVFERALIYHDSSAVAYFGDQLSNVETEEFCGSEFRSNELCAAVMNVQLDRMDGILADLRGNKKYLMEQLAGDCSFLPSHDIEGDCGTTLAVCFDSEAAARRFASAEGINGVLPIDTGKHIYRHWTPIMKKRGALNPLMDPFKMDANKDIVPDYTEDMCPQTLERLAKVVYISVDPNDDAAALDKKAKQLRAAAAQ